MDRVHQARVRRWWPLAALRAARADAARCDKCGSERFRLSRRRLGIAGAAFGLIACRCLRCGALFALPARMESSATEPEDPPEPAAPAAPQAGEHHTPGRPRRREERRFTVRIGARRYHVDRLIHAALGAAIVLVAVRASNGAAEAAVAVGGVALGLLSISAALRGRPWTRRFWLLGFALPAAILVALVEAGQWRIDRRAEDALRRGLTELHAGHYDQSVPWLRIAVALKPESAAAYADLALALARGGHGKDAERFYAEAVRLDDADADAHGGLGLALADEGRTDEGRAECQKAVALMRDEPRAHECLGRLAADAGHPEEAAREYLQAASLAPADAVVRVELGGALLGWAAAVGPPDAAGLRQRAVETFREAEGLAPDDYEATWGAGVAYASLERWGEARSALEAAIHVRPDLAKGHRELGRVLIRSGHVEEGLASLRKAVEVDANDAVSWGLLVASLSSLGRAQEAADSRRRGEKVGALSGADFDTGAASTPPWIEGLRATPNPVVAGATTTIEFVVESAGDPVAWRAQVDDAGGGSLAVPTGTYAPPGTPISTSFRTFFATHAVLTVSVTTSHGGTASQRLIIDVVPGEQ